MKKLFIFIFIAMCSVAATNAQEKGSMAAGINLGMGMGYDGDLGSTINIGAKFQYSLTDKIRLEPAFNYTLEKNSISMWDLMVNAHYLFPMLDSKVNVFPLAGVGLHNASVDLGPFGSHSESGVAINLGGGAEYKLTENISIGADLKYMIVADFGHIGINIGATYAF
ncbi:MAG: porin family protein [Bacteroidaceae bacterium]|nr:porin family protein [Bacteroidaceae bacterium]MBQ3538783.1 porin family protein [Bacteroidaceae bacterium]MBQ6693929.1 porin family protein [Bacteroidaceae bacterium]